MQRPAAMTAAVAPTAKTFLASVSTAVADVAKRAAGIVLVALEAAVGDPRLQPLADQLRGNRAAMTGWIVDRLASRTPLRADIDHSHAVDVVWLLVDPPCSPGCESTASGVGGDSSSGMPTAPPGC